MGQIFFVIILLMSFDLSAAPPSSLKKEILVDIFEIDLKLEDRIITTQSANLSTRLLLSKTSRTYFFAQRHVAQSINSVKVRAQELSVEAKKVRILRGKGGTIFSFEDEKFIYFYSTKGGKLIVSKNKQEKFDISRVHLKNAKSSKKVVSL